MFVKALTHPYASLQRVRHYGFGRVVDDIAKKFPDSVRWQARKGVRVAKVLADPVGYSRRKYHAAKIARTSPHREFFPEDKAFRITPPGTFDAIDKIVPVAQAHYKRFRELYPTGKLDDTPISYLLFDLSKPYRGSRVADLRTLPEFQELALHRPFVEMAATYLGEVPIIGGIDFQVVMPNDTTQGFQKFHIDRVDKRQFKIFITVDELDADNGGTVIMPADDSAIFAREVKHRFGRIADELVMSPKWRDKIVQCSGPPGTAFFFDTCRTVHCGARTRTRPRLLIMLQYLSNYGYLETDGNLGKVIIDKSRIPDDPVYRLLTEKL